MSDPITHDSAVTWRRAVLRRGAGTLVGAIVLAGVAPAIANAAGADVANPIAVALRASGKGIAKAFGGAGTASCETPSPSPSDVLPSASESPVVPEESASATPAESPSAAPSELPSLEPADCTEDAEESASPTASPSPSESEDAEEAEESNHGQIVRTVAQCAPRGKDPLLDVEGAPSNHGGYVKVAAHGDTLTLPWGSYDLSTQAGADDLCASLEAARADLEPAEDTKKQKKAKKAKGPQNRGGKGRRP